MVRRVVVLMSLFAVAGCASRYDKLVKSARGAEARGDSLAAARYYREACQSAKRADDPACVAADANARQATDSALSSAAGSCRSGDFRACDAALAPVRELDPNNESARRLLADAGEAHARRCFADRNDGASDLARIAACLADAASIVTDETYARRLYEARRRAAAKFYDLSQGPGLASYPGARLLLLDAALRHMDDADVRAQHAEALAQLVAGAAIPFSARLAGRGPGATRGVEDLCVGLQLGARVRCADAVEGDRGVHMRSAIEMSPVRHQAWSEQHSKRYQSGVRRYPNPAYDGAQRQLSDAERALQDLERERVEANVECESAKRKVWSANSDDRPAAEEEKRRACERYDGVEQIYKRRVDERDRARRVANDTPSFIEEPEYDTYHWTSRHFEWVAAYSFGIDVGGSAYTADDTVRVTALEQPSFAPAGVQGYQRGRDPSASDMYSQARTRVVGELRTLAERALRARSEERALACSGAVEWTGAWLQCRAEAALWRGESPNATALLASLR